MIQLEIPIKPRVGVTKPVAVTTEWSHHSNVFLGPVLTGRSGLIEDRVGIILNLSP